MRIPEIRKRLDEIANQLAFRLGLTMYADELRELAEELKRKPALKRSPKRSRPMTYHVSQEIRNMRRLHPHMSQHDIATFVGVNQGRVSEVLAGKRI